MLSNYEIACNVLDCLNKYSSSFECDSYSNEIWSIHRKCSDEQANLFFPHHSVLFNDRASTYHTNSAYAQKYKLIAFRVKLEESLRSRNKSKVVKI